MDPELWEMLEEGDSEDEVAAIIRLGQSGIVPPGTRVIARFGEIVTVRMQRSSILDIRQEAEVASLKAPGSPMGPDIELDDTAWTENLPETLQPGDERRPPSLDATGRGVVVGIVDWGLDFAHPAFRNPNGSTRLLALWDQRSHSNARSPQPYGYGLVHTRETINQALAASDPYTALSYHPADADIGSGSHGTLVASIAAGSEGTDSPVGIAPEADLVFVHLVTWGQQDHSARLGNSVTLLEAIDFIVQTAGERPWVINLSMGRTGEQHDGTTLVEQGLDAVLRMTPGCAICQSTGNYFTRRLHASGQLRPTEERILVWEVMKADITPNQLEIWYSGRDKMEVEIRAPNDLVVVRLKLGERVPLIAHGQTVGNAYQRAIEPNNLANHIEIFLYAGAPAGAWEVILGASDVVDGRFHAWIERDAACPGCQSHFRREDADPTSTTGTICNGLRTIAVGAYNAHLPDEPVASFSSMGPTRDGRLKPDLCAPGVDILGARSAPRNANGQAPLSTRMSGTSFAAPHVTGCVALMLQVAPRPLRIEEIHNLLLANTRKVSFPEELLGRVGSGYLDIERAVEAARNIGRIGPELKPANSEEAATMNEDQETEMATFVEGKTEDEADVEEATDWQNTFQRIAGDITGAFEGGKPGTLNLYDLGVISYGKHQATLASGTLYPLLKRYTELSSSETAKSMSAYLDRVKQRDETLREDKTFIQLLRDAAKEPEMNRAQNEEFSRQYWEPSKKAARETGIKSALGYVILYDTRIQGGLQQDLKKTQERLGGKVGDTVKGKEIGELEFLRVVVEERINRNLRISAFQKKQSEGLNKEADALEAQATATTDSDYASMLRHQAANKRKKAKQFAANAAALEISANKTRGPSFTALVASGDLDLFGDMDGKVYLKGKPGVAISGLKPGAAIDSATPAEHVEIEAVDEEAATKHNFVLISGGPGPYDNRDIEHDQSWANYVTPPLLLTDMAAKRKAFEEEDEEVWWFVYKSAYESRWKEDTSSSSKARKKAVKQVKDAGFTSYVDLIEGRAKERGWNLRWIISADQLWAKLKTFSKNSISRVWYWGHAKGNLWLTVHHAADTGDARAPAENEIIEVSSIDSKLKDHFRKGDVDHMNRFIGCNTIKFAEAWAKTFDVWTEGVEGKVNFSSIHKTGGEPCLADSAQVIFFSPGGKREPDQAGRARAVKCKTVSAEAFSDEAEVLEMASTLSEVPRAEAAELVELADQALVGRTVARTPTTAVLHHALSQVGMSEALIRPCSRSLLSASEIFDAFAYPGREALRNQLEQYFEVITLPLRPLESDLRTGDLLIRRDEGGPGHAAVVAAPRRWRYEELSTVGLVPETRRAGQYVQVVEGGVRPHTISDAFARRVTDEQGRLGHDTMILRSRGPFGEHMDETSSTPLAESAPGTCPDIPVPASGRPRVLIRGSVHAAVREAQRKLNAFHAYRQAAGLPGLRDAPLVEDCIFGKHTFEAVKSFQELVFPGMPVEQDGKIGDHTWAQLDAIVVGTGPSRAAQLTVEWLRVTDDAFTGPLSWDQVIGLDTTKFNLELAASGLPPAAMPAQIHMELSSRVPNLVSGSATLGTPITLDVPRFSSDPASPNRIIYRTSHPLDDIGDFLKVENRIREMATVVRNGGTSDGEFRRKLGWTSRGMATQPIVVGASTGSEALEIPDAFALFRSAGVEVLEVKVPTQPNWHVPVAIKRLVRNPADVVYYSGHGSSGSGKLLIDIENKVCGVHGTYRDWLGPADLIPAWNSTMDLIALILAGCSVLKIDFSTSPPSGPGLAWSRLLRAKGGPLVALLGYQGAAPCDRPNGDRIAAKMAERMAAGSTAFVQDWLEVNGDNNANNAAAMDSQGYWWIEGTWTGGYRIKGPKPIP